MSSLSFLLNLKGHCTSIGWGFQSHKYLHLRPAEFRGVQIILTWWMQKLPDEMSLGDLGPPLYMNIFHKIAVHWHQLLTSSCGRPTGWREKKEISIWGQQWVVAQGQVWSSATGRWILWHSDSAAALPLSNLSEKGERLLHLLINGTSW